VLPGPLAAPRSRQPGRGAGRGWRWRSSASRLP
jgi:hypothetical protein